MVEWQTQIEQWLDYLFRFGPIPVYVAIMLACFVENLFPPFPGDSFILAAGGLASVGRLHVAAALVFVVVGGMASVVVLYWLGKAKGREYFIERDFRFFSASDVQAVENKLNRYGPLVLISSRFVVGIRAGLAVAAGIGRYPAGKMVLYSTVSYILFGGLLMYLAASFIDNFDAIGRLFRTYSTAVWIPVAILLAVFVARRVGRSWRRNP
ncbi:MAG: DedA family protein [Candidatus Zixiibacteriota bacterium]